MLSHTFTILFMLLVMGSGFTISSCTPKQEPAVVIVPDLAWEDGHPERKSWSTAVYKEIVQNWESLEKAKDAEFFCPKYASLSKDQQQQVFAELWVAVAYYESSWNPKSANVDVGEDDDRDTWSIGPWQMSVVDQPNYGFNFGYKYDDLLTPEPSARLSLAILAKQIDKKGKIALVKPESGVYWSVLYRGGSYDKTSSIISRVKKQLSFCE